MRPSLVLQLPEALSVGAESPNDPSHLPETMTEARERGKKSTFGPYRARSPDRLRGRSYGHALTRSGFRRAFSAGQAIHGDALLLRDDGPKPPIG